LTTSPINHVRCYAAVKQGKTTLVPCTVVLRRLRTLLVTPGKDIWGAQWWDFRESDQVEIEQDRFSQGAFGLSWTYNEIHSYIYEYILTYRPTFSVTSTRKSKNQIGMALL